MKHAKWLIGSIFLTPVWLVLLFVEYVTAWLDKRAFRWSVNATVTRKRFVAWAQKQLSLENKS